MTHCQLFLQQFNDWMNFWFLNCYESFCLLDTVKCEDHMEKKLHVGLLAILPCGILLAFMLKNVSHVSSGSEWFWADEWISLLILYFGSLPNRAYWGNRLCTIAHFFIGIWLLLLHCLPPLSWPALSSQSSWQVSQWQLKSPVKLTQAESALKFLSASEACRLGRLITVIFSTMSHISHVLKCFLWQHLTWHWNWQMVWSFPTSSMSPCFSFCHSRLLA